MAEPHTEYKMPSMSSASKGKNNGKKGNTSMESRLDYAVSYICVGTSPLISTFSEAIQIKEKAVVILDCD
jgi:hypothetical protein